MEDQAKISEGHPDPPSGVKSTTPRGENPPIPVEPPTDTNHPLQPATGGKGIATTQSERVGVDVTEPPIHSGSTMTPPATTKETEPTPVPLVGEGEGKQMEMAAGAGVNGGDVSTCPEDSTGGIKPKVPILRLKIKKGDDNVENMTFEKQEASKNDSYCWVCHDGGDVLCCDKCARVFHVQCSGLSRAPEDEEEWFCPVCKNISKKTKRSRPPHLKDLLLLAINRMMFPGTEIFQAPVPDDIMGHYREYIFFPMDLGTIKAKVLANEYQSTREFLHDTEWILHNCIIYNGAKHALTKIAKGIVKVCKEDMREVELCPSCYSLTVNQPKDWFCIPCKSPHRVVLAKVRGYPLWPAKLISETSDKCDVRFFGQHDRSLVPKSSIQELNGPPPTPTSKTQYWNIAMMELQKYRENINSLIEQMGGAKMASVGPITANFPIVDKQMTKPAKEPRPIKSKPVLHRMAPVPQSNHYDHQSRGERSNDPSPNRMHLPVSNHVPFSPQLVEVNVNLSETEDIHGSSASFVDSQSVSEPSSPGSEPELQIDLGGRRGDRMGERASPAKTRVAPSGNRYLHPMTSSRRTVFPPESGTTDMDSTWTSPSVLVSPSSGSPMATPRNRRKGEKLSALVSTLAERQYRGAASGQSVFTGLLPSVGGAGGEGGGGQEAMDTEHDEEEESALNSQFSSQYAATAKTAIAVVDPDNKRNRKRKFGTNPPPIAKKSARIQNMSKPTSSSSPSAADPYAFNGSNTPSPINQRQLPHPDVPHVVGTPNSLKMDLPAVVTTTPGSVISHSLAAVTPTHPPQQPQAKSTSAGPSGKSTPGHPKKRPRGRPPKNSAARAAATAAKVSLASSAPSVAGTSTASATPTTPVSLPQIFSVPTSGQNGVRGGATALEPEEEESSSFSEGSGLLAETIRKVDRSFRARLCQMAGGTEDMGYQYFSEKFMMSIKTVLIEMLSTLEAKGRMGSKQLREQLHQAWPVPDSRAGMEQLRKELREEMKQSLEVVRASAELERQQVVSEVKRQAEVEKDIAIAETKKKKWCSYCLKEAQYNCCWNANYCNEVCQQAHWPEHMKTCTQVQQPVPRTPAPVEMAGTPVSKVPPTPQIPVALPPPGQDPQGGGFVYTSTPTSAQVHIPLGHMMVNHNSNSSAIGMTSGVITGGPPALNHGGASILQTSQQLTQQQQHRLEPLVPIVHMETASQPVEVTPGLESSISHIEQIPNDSVMLNSANPASPPTHIRTLLLNAGNKSSVITGTPILTSHISGSNAIEGAQTFALSGSHTLISSSDHSSNTSGSLINLHAQPPMSPASPASVNVPPVHNPASFGWPYPQQVIIGAENYPHPLPLLPAMQATTPSSQPYQFYKAF